MIGETILHYKILEKLGEGGMGVVYLAEDHNLERKVAIKFLPRHIAGNSEERERFKIEAKAAAALNHSNIATIYAIEESEDDTFIVMEYIDGIELKDKIKSGPIPTKETINTAIQIAEGLEAAHKKGIVHRDIKSQNIMITNDGKVKVMDFGLAKMKGGSQLTKAGSTLGTLSYMAPEQAKGEEVDQQSDIWSFGVVLYEMLTGKMPFAGDYDAAIVYNILNEEPSLDNIQDSVLQLILKKCLEKEKTNRYQSVTEILKDLRIDKQISGEKQTVNIETPKKKSRLPVFIAIGITGIILVVAAYFIFFNSEKKIDNLPPMKTINFTSYAGQSGYPAFSPDGNSIAFAWEGEQQDNADIYVKLIDAGSPLRLTHNPAPDIYPAWSPDGSYIAFFRLEGNGGSYYIIPSLGGDERKIADVKYYGVGIDWSPDGKTLIVSASDSSIYPHILFISVESGKKEALSSPDMNGVYGDNNPKISPDGKTVAFIKSLSYSISELYTIPSNGGEEKRLTFDSLLVGGIAWTANGDDIVFSSNRGGNKTLWRIPSNGGSPTAVPGSGDNVEEIDIAKKGHYLAYRRGEQNANIWRVNLGSSASAQRVATEFISSSGMQRESEFSHNGKYIVFTSNRTGSGEGGNEIWRCNVDGTNQVELTFLRGPSAGTPQWSPDDRFIAFDSREKGNGNIYVISSSGGTPRQLTTNTAEDNIPRWSNDGRWIYFSSNRTGEYQIWKVSVDGGKEIQVTKNGGFAAYESFDGNDLYFVKRGLQSKIMKLSLTSGDEEPVDNRLNGISWGAWIITGKGIFFVKNDTTEQSKIYFYNFKNREIKQILETPKTIYTSSGTLAVSPDGRYLLFTQYDRVTSDIMLIQNFQ
jgi:serine/threonine protein kinase/ribosomal protein L24E